MQTLQSSLEHQLRSLGAGDMHRCTCNHGPREKWEISMGWLVKEGRPAERKEKKKLFEEVDMLGNTDALNWSVY